MLAYFKPKSIGRKSNSSWTLILGISVDEKLTMASMFILTLLSKHWQETVSGRYDGFSYGYCALTTHRLISRFKANTVSLGNRSKVVFTFVIRLEC